MTSSYSKEELMKKWTNFVHFVRKLPVNIVDHLLEGAPHFEMAETDASLLLFTLAISHILRFDKGRFRDRFREFGDVYYEQSFESEEKRKETGFRLARALITSIVMTFSSANIQDPTIQHLLADHDTVITIIRYLHLFGTILPSEGVRI
jgi:hypothetical protein